MVGKRECESKTVKEPAKEAEMEEKKSSGKGKFLLGAALGAIAGAAAGHFISKKAREAEEAAEKEEEEIEKAAKVAESKIEKCEKEKAEKKPAAKK